MNVIDLLETLLPMILDCFTKDGEEKTMRRLRKRHGLVQWRVYRTARKAGCDRACARQCATDACEALCDMDDEDLRDLIEEAKGTE